MEHETRVHPVAPPAGADRAGSGDPVAGLLRSLESAVEALKAAAKERIAVARELARVARPTVLYDLKRLAKAHATLQKKLPPGAARRCGVESMLRALEDHVRAAPDRIRRALGRGLKRACEKEGLDFTVVSREEPVEVRIPPLSVLLDFKHSRAVLQYARDPIASCRLEAGAILKAHEKAVKSLDRAFKPDDFFDACRKAYLRVLRLDKRKDGDRVEIVRFLPELAFLMQPRKFRENPTARNYRPYAKARFAYDVHRLRQAGGLVKGGLRLNFGVATGITATRKNRVIYMEDPSGAGEYKLTVFFTSS